MREREGGKEGRESRMACFGLRRDRYLLVVVANVRRGSQKVLAGRYALNRETNEFPDWRGLSILSRYSIASPHLSCIMSGLATSILKV